MPAVAEAAVVRRTRDGWRVGHDDVPDLTCAMVLADLIAAELPPELTASSAASAKPAAAQPSAPAPPSAPGQSESAPGQPPPGQPPPGQPPPGQSVPGRSTAGRSSPGQQAGQPPSGAQSGAGDAADDKAAASEASRLRATVGQLERALTARVRVEQAIGVLAERHRIQPRQAFEQLRSAARNRGRRVIDIAADVVASATNPLLQLPDELARPRSSARNRARRPRGALDSE
jgi:hypothetical protein